MTIEGRLKKIPTLLSISIIFNVFYQLFQADTQFWKIKYHTVNAALQK